MMQENLVNTSSQIISCGRQSQDRARISKLPNPMSTDDQTMKCPRCDSSNTKFCYYNNYSLTQPRHFCKACKRYWTKGGAIRNVPVGGGCRKNKRSKQRSVDRDRAPSPASALGEDQTVLLQKDQFSVASSSHCFFVGSDGEATTGLAFERLDQGTQSFPVNSIPLSINWAGQASSDATLNLQPFDRSTILGLNLAGHHVKQETARLQINHATDFGSVYDPQLNLIARTQPPLADTLGSYTLCMDHSYGMVPSSGDLQWRLPPPRLVTMMEGEQAGCLNSRSANEGMRSDQSVRIIRSKSALEEIPLSTLIASTQEADRLPCEWPSNSEGFFGDSGDGNSAYWSNGSWPQDDIYEEDQLG